MKDYAVTLHSIPQLMREIEAELQSAPVIQVTTQDASTGKWGMAKLWRRWMEPTAQWMAARGAYMPLCFKANGEPWGRRPFNKDDAHELFTSQWLGLDADGTRLSWSRSGRDGMRPATKGERFQALRKHEAWATERGLLLFTPRDSEYMALQEEENQ